MTQYMMYPPNDQLIQIDRHNEREMKHRESEVERQKFWIEFLKRNEELQKDLVNEVFHLAKVIGAK